MGFEEQTDWDYYTRDTESGEKNYVPRDVTDPNQPQRTKTQSGSVLRIYRGELRGALAQRMRSQGLGVSGGRAGYWGEGSGGAWGAADRLPAGLQGQHHHRPTQRQHG
mmetsp:Transcript_16638/g.20348  ORF Transcript_16638/g.20348 Transcript_16638/m.20348 type:complete len:108 (-) Transcript_16638:332-655(-)